MREIYVADCETEPFLFGRIPHPFVWGLYRKDEFTIFWGKNSTRDFINYVRNLDSIIYAHNGGKFDWHYVLPYVDDATKLLLIDGRIAAFKLGKAEFRDSYSILPIPLRAYKKDDVDYTLFEPKKRNKPVNKEKIKDYLRTDCIYLYELVTAFIKRFGCHQTLAVAATACWRGICKQKSIHTTEQFYNVLQPYYYGGRCECFEVGIFNLNFIVLDINSAYSFAMLHNHPFGLSLDEHKGLLKNKSEIERSFIRIITTSTGLFPIRTKTGLEFPNDNKEREFFITGWEYLTAKKLNLLQKHKIETSLSVPAKPINFKNYVKYFFKEKERARKEKRQADYLFAKLMLNSLYGKFGANPSRYNEYIVTLQPEKFDTSWSPAGWFSDKTIMSRELPEYKQHFNCVATAASITGFVRAMLMQALKTSERPLYCDTDSVAVVNHNLLIGNEIGQWKIEARCDYAAIAGKKLYAFHTDKGDYKTACKGVRLTPQQIIKIAKGETFRFSPDVPTYSVFNGISFTERTVKMTKKC